jgi:hypothetical protein
MQIHPIVLALRLLSLSICFAWSACAHAKDHVRARAGRHALVAHMPGFQDDQGAISSSIYFNVMPAGE